MEMSVVNMTPDYDLEDSLRAMVEAYFPVVESDKSNEIRAQYYKNFLRS